MSVEFKPIITYVLLWSVFLFGTHPALNAQTSPVGTNFLVNQTRAESQQYASCAVGYNGDFVLVWESFGQDGDDYGIYARRYNADGTASTAEFQVNTTIDKGQRMPVAALDSAGNLTIVWMSEEQDGDGWGIYMRRYNADNSPNTSERRVNGTTGADQKYPAIAMNDKGDHVIAWTEIDETTSSYRILHRRYSGTVTLSGDTQVDTTTMGYDGDVAVAIDSAGNYIIVWQHLGIDGSDHGIVAQRYLSDGALLGEHFIVNTTTSDNQINPSVAMMDHGFSVISWSSYDQDGDHYGIYAQMYDETGSPHLTEFMVNDSTEGVQDHADVVMSRSGGMFFVWDDYTLDGSFSGLYGKVIDTTGNTVSPQFIINTKTDLFQQFGAIGVDSSSHYVVVWQDGDRSTTNSVDVDDYAIVAQRLVVDTEPPIVDCPETQNDSYSATCSFTLPDYIPLATVTDNEDENPTIVQVPAPGSMVNSDTVIKIIATDLSGNMDSCSFDLILADTTRPVLACPSDQNESFDGSCQFTLPDYTGLVTADDNCDPGIVIVQVPSASTVVSGNTMITMTVNDASGNSNNCTFDVLLSDNTIPTISCPENQMDSYDADCEFTMLDYTGLVTASDNCDPNPMISQSISPGSKVSSNTIVTMTVSDASGNMNSCMFTVILSDTTRPTLTCPGDQMDSYDENCQFTLLDYSGLVTTNDNCDASPVISQSPVAGTVVSSNTTIAISVTDASGNMNSCTFDVILADTTRPAITCPGDQMDSYDASCEFTLPDYTDLVTVNDNCDATPTLVQMPLPGSTVSSTTTITMTATDASGNMNACTFDVILSDTTRPTVSCPGDQMDSYDENCQFTLLDYTGLVTADDNCDASPMIAQSPIAGTMVSGNTTITMTVTDAAGNMNTCTFNVILADTTRPTVTCPGDQMDSYDENCQFALLDYTGLVTTDDNCDASPMIAQSPMAGTMVSGNTLITMTVTDMSGNIDTCTFDVILSDTTRPTVTCPGDQMDSYDENCQFTLLDYTGLVTTDDNCDPSPMIAQSPMAGTMVSGNTTITMTVTDASGNMNTCTFDVILSDTTRPTVTCPGDQMDSYDENCQFTLLDYTGLVITNDNCDPSPVITQSPVAGTMVTSNTTITITVTDASGNLNSCTFDVILSDTTRPAITCPGDQMDSYDASCEFTIPDYTNLVTVNDNCDATPTLVQTPLPGSTVSSTTTITMTATDASGNMNLCTFDVILSDTTKPEVNCPANQSGSYDENCQFMVLDYTSLVTFSDNCDQTPSITQIPAPGTLVNESPTIKMLVMDASGNLDSCMFQVVLSDTSKPLVVCPGDQSGVLDANCEFVIPDYSSIVLVGDYCDASALYTQEPPAGTVVTSHTNIVAMIDGAGGNSGMCSFNVILSEANNPPPAAGMIPADTYRVPMDMESGGVVESPDIVEFKAGNCITLSEGFEVELGADFAAYIEICLPTMPNNFPTDGIELQRRVEEEGLILESTDHSDLIKVSFLADSRVPVNLSIYDLHGQILKSVLSEESFRDGLFTLSFDQSLLDPGMYYFSISGGETAKIKRFTVQ